MAQERNDQKEEEYNGDHDCDVDEHDDYDEEEKGEFEADSDDKETSTVTCDWSHCGECTAIVHIPPILTGTPTWKGCEGTIIRYCIRNPVSDIILQLGANLVSFLSFSDTGDDDFATHSPDLRLQYGNWDAGKKMRRNFSLRGEYL